MNIVFLGLPGTGKGTQAEELARELDVPHIATGDIFREAIGSQTELGQKARKFLDAGELVPDEVTCGMVKERLAQEDTAPGFILDGFPRTLAQAEALDQIMQELGRELELVIYFAAPEEVLIRRLSGRRVCSSCGATYHVDFKPPVEQGTCDRCGGELKQRDDDREETVIRRLQVNREKTRQLVEYYERQSKLTSIAAEGSLEQVRKQLKEAVASL